MKRARVLKCILLFTLVLCTMASVLTFTSCDRDYDEAEVLSEAKSLLMKAEVLNEVYWGDGIDYITGGFTDGIYKQASDIHLASLGFTTIAELKALTEATYSSSYVHTIYTTKLDEAPLGFVLYIQKWDDEIEKTIPACIMVNTEMVRVADDVSYDYTTLRVEDVEDEIVTVLVDATVTNLDGESQVRTLRVQLVEESDGWRINSPTFAKYFVEE